MNESALLGPLADNGGPTQAHVLLPGSPAIDAGSNALAVDENGSPLTTDQRGEARIQPGTVDTYVVPVAFTPVEYRSFGARDLSLSSSEDNGQLGRRSLKGSTASVDFSRGSCDTLSSVKVAPKKSFTTAAELFDALAGVGE